MPSLGQALEHLKPEAVPNRDYMVADALDGEGPKIVHWDQQALGPRPTESDIAQAQLTAAAALTKQRVKDEGIALAVAPMLEGTTDEDMKWEALQIIAIKIAAIAGEAELVPPALKDAVDQKFTSLVSAGLEWATKSAQVDAIVGQTTDTPAQRVEDLEEVTFEL